MNADVGLISQDRALSSWQGSGLAFAGCQRVSAPPDHRERPAGRFRYLLANPGRPMDPRSCRFAARRHLLLHEDGRAMDIIFLARAGPVRSELQSGRLDRTDRPCGKRHRHNVRASHLYPRSPNSFDLRDPDCAGSAGTFRGAFLCASPRARAAGHGRVGERTDGGKRAPAGAVMVVAAADIALGEPARRISSLASF